MTTKGKHPPNHRRTDEDIDEEHEVIARAARAEELRMVAQERNLLLERFPLCEALERVMNSHARLVRLQQLEAPDPVIDEELRMREERLGNLLKLFGRDTSSYDISLVINALKAEIEGH